MSMEICNLCGDESTPWFHIDGHICSNCFYNYKIKKSQKKSKSFLYKKKYMYIFGYIFSLLFLLLHFKYLHNVFITFTIGIFFSLGVFYSLNSIQEIFKK
jgi:hypothetical protein